MQNSRGGPWFVKLMLLAWLGLCGCSNHDLATPSDGERISPAKQMLPMTIKLTSHDFEPGAAIPRACTGEGEDRSPQIAWAQVPAGTRELALICDDPDAPTAEPWVHWVIYGVAPTPTSLPAGLQKSAVIQQPVQAKQGRNSWPTGQTVGYRGPLPPPGHGVHHYHFTLYALDQELSLDAGATKNALRKAMRGHILATGELIGTYQR